MYIGIYDQDLLTERKFFPNIETMQISAYHKQQKDYVELIIDENDDLVRFNKIYYVKNKNNKNFIPELISNPKVECIGLGFTNGKVQKVKDYLYAQPDVSIYTRYLSKNMYHFSKDNIERANRMQKYQNARLDFGTGKIDDIASPQCKNLIVYDLDILNIEGIYEYCQQFRKVKFIHPIYTDDIDTVLKWTNADWFMTDNKMYYTGEVDKKTLFYYSKNKVNKKPFWRKIDINLSPVKSRLLFSELLNQILYITTHKGMFYIEYSSKSSIPFYNVLFNKLLHWHSERRWGKSFKEFFMKSTSKKNAEIFDKMCELDYNINRMVNVNISKVNTIKGGWQYVDRV